MDRNPLLRAFIQSGGAQRRSDMTAAVQSGNVRPMGPGGGVRPSGPGMLPDNGGRTLGAAPAGQTYPGNGGIPLPGATPGQTYPGNGGMPLPGSPGGKNFPGNGGIYAGSGPGQTYPGNGPAGNYPGSGGRAVDPLAPHLGMGTDPSEQMALNLILDWARTQPIRRPHHGLRR